MNKVDKDTVIKYCIHIGLPKTGNKFLRRRFFPALRGIYYCEVETAFKEFMNYFRQVGDFEFDVSHAGKILDESSNASKYSLLHVLSDDVFSAFPWNGAVLRKRNCDRIAAIFEDPHVVIVLRNQFDMLQSHYLQYIKEGATDNEGFSRQSKMDLSQQSRLTPRMSHHWLRYAIESRLKSS